MVQKTDISATSRARSPRLITAATIAAIAVSVALYLGLKQGTRLDAAAPTDPSVLTAKTELRDIPVELRGIGTIQAVNTVTVKSRVSGQIMEIAFVEGQSVHPGTVLARIDARPLVAALHQAEATRAKDEAQLANARRDLDRLQSLAPEGFATVQSLETQRALLASLEATVAGDQAAQENARIQLDYATITSPIEGVTGIRMVDAGNIVSPNDPGIAVITQIQPIAAIFTLPADSLAGMAVGKADAPVAVIAYDREDRTKLAEGTLSLVDNLIDRATNTVRLKALFANADRALKPGQFVNAHLLKSVLQGAVAVPNAALQRDDKGAFVFVLGADRAIEKRPIVAGPVFGDWSAVLKGLAAGEKVITEGQYGLRPGTKVTVRGTGVPAAAQGQPLNIP